MTSEFLSHIVPVILKYNSLQELKKRSGEYYNVFYSLGLQYDEVHFHSKFISDLLNPKSLHGFRHLFFKEFIETLLETDNTDNKEVNNNLFENIDFTTCKVHTEVYIGPIFSDYTEGGRIDILIEFQNKNKIKKAIVIENKIFAYDQQNQIVRYRNYCKRRYKDNNFIILYLTLFGDEPKDYSTEGDKEHYYSISYVKFIKEWIEKCILLSVEKPKLREVLIQYKEILNYFKTQNIIKEEKDMKEEFVKKLLEGNMLKYVNEAALYIEPAKQRIIDNFQEELNKKCKELEIEFVGSVSTSKYSTFYFQKGKYGLAYEFQEKNYIALYKYIYIVDKKMKDLTDEEKQTVVNLFSNLTPNVSYPKSYTIVGDYEKEEINGNNLMNWNIDLISDMNHHRSDYVDYFISEAKETFKKLGV